jgi:phosphoglycerate dehydrogenase-like enzyme
MNSTSADHSSLAAPQVMIGPDPVPDAFIDAIVAGGGQVVDADDATAVVWVDNNRPGELATLLEAHPGIDWVQLPFAGIERFAGFIDDSRTWTCGKGVYAEPVAELALTMMLAGLRHVVAYSRVATWTDRIGHNVLGGNVTILGGGGITESLVRLLGPFDCRITVVRNRVQPMDGVADVIDADRYVDALPGADAVVLALPLTADTEGIIARNELEMMEPHSWLVNVARGAHVVTDDLVWALTTGEIGGAALDVTNPEPLPDGHPLWSLPNCLITPHTANTAEMAVPLLSERITANVRRYARGEALIGPVHVDLGY